MRKATNIARKRLISMGTCVGKFTKTGKFHLQVTALDIIAPYAKVRPVLSWQAIVSQLSERYIYVFLGTNGDCLSHGSLDVLVQAGVW